VIVIAADRRQTRPTRQELILEAQARAARLDKLMLERKIGVEELHRASDVSASVIRDILDSITLRPRRTTISKLADGFDKLERKRKTNPPARRSEVSKSWLMWGDEMEVIR
jgi:hypothetical protein